MRHYLPYHSRRRFLTFGAALAATHAHAAEDAALNSYSASVVIDANLVADPLYKDGPISPRLSTQIRSSGLTVLKQTLGDTDSDFAGAQNDIIATRKAIARDQTTFMQVATLEQIHEAKRTHRVGIIFSFESATMLEGRVASIDLFANQGVRVMGLSYNPGSPFGGGVAQPPTSGLTALGREAVARMVARGVTVDLSHSNEATSLQALASTRCPMLITHAGSAAVHPNPRNRSDRLLRALADSGGVIGIYTLSFLGNYPDNPTLEIFMRHLLHALNVCGEDHVGIGTDSLLSGLDTSPSGMAAAERHEAVRRSLGVSAPEELAQSYVVGLNSLDRYRIIFEEMHRRGIPPRVAEKIMGSNFLRVFALTWGSPS